ncbi:MAG TPA: hypothetical protein VH301_11460 [Usitatibacter sp.]|jgi:hypothetical protein|nr:hypothetical protein [Usitatibacter sp.]
MRRSTLLALLVAAALSPAAIAQKAQVSGAVATAPGQAKAVAVVMANATVQSVDPATRTVVLKTGGGEVHSFVASDEVRNFDQIKVGDKVKAKYVESVSIDLKKGGGGTPGRTENTAIERSQPGAKPGGTAMREITVVADVVKVDTAKKHVSIKNDKGEVTDLEVSDPEQLKLVKVGDQVHATYTVALAISLEPAAAPAKKK